MEDDVGVAVRVERGPEGDEVDAGVGQVLAQDVEVVAVGEDVGGELGHRSPRAGPAGIGRRQSSSGSKRLKLIIGP